MSGTREPADEATETTLRRALGSVERTMRLQHLSLTATWLVIAGLVIGYLGFGLVLTDPHDEVPIRGGLLTSSAFSDPLDSFLPLAVYACVLTPLSAITVMLRTERVTTVTLGAWSLAALFAVFAALHAIVAGAHGMLGIGTFHLLGAAILGWLGIWLLPNST